MVFTASHMESQPWFHSRDCGNRRGQSKGSVRRNRRPDSGGVPISPAFPIIARTRQGVAFHDLAIRAEYGLTSALDAAGAARGRGSTRLAARTVTPHPPVARRARPIMTLAV